MNTKNSSYAVTEDRERTPEFRQDGVCTRPLDGNRMWAEGNGTLNRRKQSLHEGDGQIWTGGCLHTATGMRGCGGAMDMVDAVDLVDARVQKDEKDQRLRLELGQRGVWQVNVWPLSRRIWPYLGVSRSVSPFREYFFRVLADGHQGCSGEKIPAIAPLGTK
ncbi:MAG: hypothetical protein JWR26_1743 [Pedosphaera sp.]|nr:hypothetical protein [Pedosphaera sp.]